jgi:hypothetical protein
MTIAIEPMITQGHYATKTLKDKWTVVTADGSAVGAFRAYGGDHAGWAESLTA